MGKRLPVCRRTVGQPRKNCPSLGLGRASCCNFFSLVKSTINQTKVKGRLRLMDFRCAGRLSALSAAAWKLACTKLACMQLLLVAYSLIVKLYVSVVRSLARKKGNLVLMDPGGGPIH